MDKILKIQGEIGVLVKTETNPFFKSKYMDINGLLEQLLPLLEKHKLVVMQPLSNINGKPALRTIILEEKPVFQTTENGIRQFPPIVDDVIPLPDLQDPQKMGSAITYYRRYALQSLFLLRAEDDDGNNASKDKKPDTSFARQRAEKDIRSSNNIQVLDEVLEKIQKSKILTSKDKEELGFLANERREEFDPTLN